MHFTLGSSAFSYATFSWVVWKSPVYNKGHIVTGLWLSMEIAEESLSVCGFQCEGFHNQTLWARGVQGICSLGIACWQQWPLGTRPRPLFHTGNHITSALAWCDRDSALHGFNVSVKIWKGLYFVFILLTKLFLKGSRDSQMINTNKSTFYQPFFSSELEKNSFHIHQAEAW